MREMKDSGVEWIGKIPKDWEIVPLTKQLDSIVDYRGKTPEKTEEGTFLVTAKNIKDKFLNFYIPIPPYDEQKKIADYITDKVNHIEVEIDKRNKLIKKYQEYKKSLIYEVVTGKKEV